MAAVHTKSIYTQNDLLWHNENIVRIMSMKYEISGCFSTGNLFYTVVNMTKEIFPGELLKSSKYMIRDAAEGIVDPEVENAAENMSDVLNFSSKDALIDSTLDYYNNGTEEEEEEDVQAPPPSKKIALLIGQGGEGMPNETNITKAVQNDLGRLANLLEKRGYQLISKTNNGTGRFNYNVDKNYVNNKLFPWLRENLTENNRTKVFICIFAHGDKKNESFVFYDHDPEDNVHNYTWENFSLIVDKTTLDRNDDGTITTDEKESPMYSKMVIVVESCYGGLAINHLKANDMADRRIIITAGDDDEKVYNIGRMHFFGEPHAIFLTHFINFLEGNWENEYIFTFIQTLNLWMLLVVLVAAVIGAIASLWLAGVGAIPAAIAALVTIFITATIIALTQSITCHILGGPFITMYEAWYGTALPTKWGHGFFWLGSSPQLYNDELAVNTRLN